MSTQLTILVVDDEPQVGAAIAYMLKHERVQLATSGEQAIEACKSMSFDLILCDLLMPKMSGVRVYEALRELGTGLHEKVVFTTGWSAGAADLDGVENIVLTKPFKPGELERVLEQSRKASGHGRIERVEGT